MLLCVFVLFYSSAFLSPPSFFFMCVGASPTKLKTLHWLNESRTIYFSFSIGVNILSGIAIFVAAKLAMQLGKILRIIEDDIFVCFSFSMCSMLLFYL